MSQAAEDEPGFLASTIATLRLIAGWACAALGVLNLAMGLAPASYVTFHVVLAITGLLLLAPGPAGRRRPPGPAVVAGGTVALVGLAATTVPALAVECCSGGYAVRHGFPFTMLARDPGGWRFDTVRTVADLVFWICAGLIVMLALTRVRPTTTRPAEPNATGRHAAEPYPSGPDATEQHAAEPYPSGPETTERHAAEPYQPGPKTTGRHAAEPPATGRHAAEPLWGPSPGSSPAGHAEQRSVGRHARDDQPRTADDENVGGLP
ncbi:hypothetical protein [Paractinoplanes brasiliensis]|uniref:Uncharacterized protein n=1 Tax=Paractinoplanes brasiliensis TaxID=52695 RepID=A0A4R6JUJ3_9ACTN|nr:hypothetical protein [Actinoplanes brasiliensis]TDO40249.1 hypothetical protein C8E87_3960 [Actinoplanes brasiliensis]GID25314.1 hypothetical protein Abr02nite_02970 [Actinoplanes brasiliensis]